MKAMKKASFTKPWLFNTVLVVGSAGLGLTLWRVGVVDDGKWFRLFALGLVFFCLLTLPYPRLCPRVHRNMRRALRLDDPEQKRKAGLQDDSHPA